MAVAVGGIATFEAVADALVAVGASDRDKIHILAAAMNVVAVPALSLERYRGDEAIVELFSSRGVRFAEPREGGAR
jgi:hypothetical protein